MKIKSSKPRIVLWVAAAIVFICILAYGAVLALAWYTAPADNQNFDYAVWSSLHILGLKNGYDFDRADAYTDQFIAKLKEDETVCFGEIFDFSFSKAYLVDEPYWGETSLESYFGIEMDHHDTINPEYESWRQILFVDDQGEFLYNYITNSKDIFFPDPGIIIYPDSMCRRLETQSDRMRVEFMGIDDKDYYRQQESYDYNRAAVP